MKTFWICLLISLALHVLFFPQLLGSLMHSGNDEFKAKVPERVKIRMVERKKPKVEVKKPPKPVVKKPQPRPKPKVQAKPKPKPKPVVKPAPVKPKPVPKPVAQPRPQPKPKAKPKAAPRPSYPKAPSYPKSQPAAPRSKPASQKRLNRKGGRPTGGGVKVPTPQRPSGGQTGVNPNELPRGPVEPVGIPGGTGQGTPEPPPARQPVEPAPVPASEPPKPKPEPPKPKPEPPKPKPAEPAPSARKAVISVPTIDPPAKFRREKLKGQLWVRFDIEAGGSFTVSLFESSGNPEFDDFVLNEVRRTAQVEPAIGDDGKPKSSRPRKPVDINID